MANLFVEIPGIPKNGYDIHLESGVSDRVEQWVDDRDAVIVTNTTIADLYREKLSEALSHASILTVPDGEQYKTLETAAALYTLFVQHKVYRNTVVVAFGGGVIGDLAGFAAATYMRGVRLIQIPTSLLAMVDSSVGGKVGVDLPQGKNLVGAFKQPELVLIDPDLLRTLPERQWWNGMAEVIKRGLLADEALLEPALHTLERAAELIQRAIQVKIDIVQRDPYEQSERAHLNLGHTFAHAIEQVSGYRWLHGEAVAVGLLAAAKLSHRLGLCDSALPTLVEETLMRSHLPTHTALDTEMLYEAMATDKKWMGGKNRFVLLHEVGQPVIMEDVPAEAVMSVLEELR